MSNYFNREQLPEIGVEGGLQMINDPNNFQYNNGDPYEDQEEQSFRFGNEPSTPPGRSTGQRKELQQSPNKTGGQIKLKELQQDDMSREPYLGRDATVVIEGEMRQFDNRKAEKIQRYVESLATGTFTRVKKDINLQLQDKDGDAKSKKLQSSRENFEIEMKEAQRLWVSRINKLFNLFLGLLAGMSLMHLIIILSQPDKLSFLQLYSKACHIIAVIFIALSSFALVLGVTLSLMYKQKTDEKMTNMNVFAMEFRQHYIMCLVSSILLAICTAISYVLPHFTNKFFYWQVVVMPNPFTFRNPDNVTEVDIAVFQGLSAFSNILFIITWIVASALNKASITDLDLDPEDGDPDMFDDDSTAVSE